MTASYDADRTATPGDCSHESTVKRPKIERRRGADDTFELVVLEGPDAGLRIAISAEANVCLLVGHSALCGLRLADRAVCARHCSFEIVGNRLRMTDLSADATRVNGVLAKEAFLGGGEVVRVGDTLLSVHRSEMKSGVVRRVAAFGRLRGESDAMRALYPIFAGLAQSARPVLIEGEAGVGKRLLAEELHRQGMPEAAPFIAFAERGARPAEIARALFSPDGLVDRARGGTLFIAEVRDLDEAGQQQLAACLDAMKSEDASRSVRLIAATRGTVAGCLIAALEELFADGGVSLPPLRAREGDVVALARQFWVDLGGSDGLPDDFTARFDDHSWPGNVRELRIAVQDRLRHGGDEAAAESQVMRRPAGTTDSLAIVIERDLPFVDARHAILAEFEKRYVERALERSGKSISRAAAASGIAHRYFQVLKSRRRPA